LRNCPFKEQYTTSELAGRAKDMTKSHLKLVTPAIQKRTVMPKRRRNGDLRTREYLTEAEVERLIKAAIGNRHGRRDTTMILVATGPVGLAGPTGKEGHVSKFPESSPERFPAHFGIAFV
jgi:hypothetical protein